MRSARSFPYLRASADAIEAAEWKTSAGLVLLDRMLLNDWDVASATRASRSIQVKPEKIISSAQVAIGARLAVLATWWSAGTGLRGMGDINEFKIESSVSDFDVELSLAVEGREVHSQLQLRTSLVLIEPVSQMTRNPLAVRRPGAILWEDSTTLIVEGEAPRFPVTAVDFVSSNIGPAGACWSFEWEPKDLTLPAMATMRLYVNSLHKPFYAAMIGNQDDSPTVTAIRSAAKYGVAKEMIGLAMEHAGELESSADDYLPGSGGRVLLDLIERLFPGRGPVRCREDLAQDPGLFDAIIQAKLGLFSEKLLQGAGP